MFLGHFCPMLGSWLMDVKTKWRGYASTKKCYSGVESLESLKSELGLYLRDLVQWLLEYLNPTVWFMAFSTWFFANSFKKNKARFTKHTWSVNLPFFLIDLQDSPTEKRYWARISENQFLYWKLHAFYSAILTSCFRQDVNNVKERRNAGDLVPKILTL